MQIIAEISAKIEKRELSAEIDREGISADLGEVVIQRGQGTVEITSNGPYDVSRYAEADVNVPLPSGRTRITSNGVKNVYDYAEAEVAVPLPSGRTRITSNGVKNVYDYAEAEVAVPQTEIEELNVTENGTYTAPAGKAYSPVEVNVPSVAEISTAAGMAAFLTPENDGKYVKYTGPTTAAYVSGWIYKVVFTPVTFSFEKSGTYGFEVNNTILSLDHTVYGDIYQSQNYNINNSKAIYKVSWTGANPVTVWINSYAESNYDYTMVSDLDAASYPTIYTSAPVHTRGFQHNPRLGLNTTNWKKHTYQPNDGGTHHFWVVYTKDGSQHSNDDRGYFVLENANTIEYQHYIPTDEAVVPVTDTDVKDIAGHRYAQVQDENLIPGNIKKDVTVLGIVGTHEGGGQQGYQVESVDNGDGTQTLNIDGINGYTLSLEVRGSGNTDAGYETARIILNGTDELRPFTHAGGSMSFFSNYVFRNISKIKCTGFSATYWASPSSHTLVMGGTTTSISQNTEYTLTGDATLSLSYLTCLTGDTLVLMADGSHKRIDEVDVGDIVACVDDSGNRTVDVVVYSDRLENKSHTEYDVWTFENGYAVKTVHRHRFYNVERAAYVYMDEWEMGEHTITEDGEQVALIGHENVQEPVNHYKISTEKYHNFFADGMLTGSRFAKPWEVEG